MIYILSCTVERDICAPLIFRTKEKAQEEMKRQFIKAFDLTEKQFNENFCSKDGYNGYQKDLSLDLGSDSAICFTSDFAFGTNLNHSDVDWHIHEVKDYSD